MEFTGERYIPGAAPSEFAARIHLEHVHRYALAATLVHGRVLDLGCGAGYGLALLGRRADRVFALDVDPASLAYARTAYGGAGFAAAAADARQIPFVAGAFDWVVCFETLEHVENGERLVAEAARVLRDGGVFVVSSPNRGEYARTFPGHSNPFHRHEYEPEELEQLVRGHFRHVALLGQRLVIGSGMWPLPGRLEGAVDALVVETDPYSPPARPLYGIAVCSNAASTVERIGSTLFAGSLEAALDGLIAAMCRAYEGEMAKRDASGRERMAQQASHAERLQAELTRIHRSRMWRVWTTWHRIRRRLRL